MSLRVEGSHDNTIISLSLTGARRVRFVVRHSNLRETKKRAVQGRVVPQRRAATRESGVHEALRAAACAIHPTCPQHSNSITLNAQEKRDKSRKAHNRSEVQRRRASLVGGAEQSEHSYSVGGSGEQRRRERVAARSGKDLARQIAIVLGALHEKVVARILKRKEGKRAE
jgi:hypothetical protein